MSIVKANMMVKIEKTIPPALHKRSIFPSLSQNFPFSSFFKKVHEMYVLPLF
jgi:hypothetical protein